MLKEPAAAVCVFTADVFDERRESSEEQNFILGQSSAETTHWWDYNPPDELNRICPFKSNRKQLQLVCVGASGWAEEVCAYRHHVQQKDAGHAIMPQRKECLRRGEEVGRCGGGGLLDGQLEGDVHLSFLGQRDDFRKLYDL